MSNSIEIKCGSLVIANGNFAVGSVDRIDIDGARVIDVVRPLFAYDVSILARDNREKTISFRITTEYAAGRATALANAFSLDETLPSQADLTITLDDGIHEAVILFHAAGWERVKVPEPAGITLRVDYTVRVGAAIVTLDDSPLGAAFAMPLLIEAQIDPFVIPADKIGSVPAGELLVCRSLQCDGELDLSAGTELALIGAN